jgi:hypothetical protein
VIITNRKVPIYVGAAVIFLVIISLLTTRQILPYNTDSELILFITTIIVCYGFGSWFLLRYSDKVSRELRASSPLINGIHLATVVIQFILLGILVSTMFSDVRVLPTSVYAISSAAATVIMGLISYKFFSWYKMNKRNYTVLFYALAAVTLALVIANDAWSKLLLVDVIEEDTAPGTRLGSFWIYSNNDAYGANIQYKVVKADTTLIYLVPYEDYQLYRSVNFVSLIPYVFTWIATTALLYKYYNRVSKFPLKYWILLSIPLGFFLLGSQLVFNVPPTHPDIYYYRLLFRIGTVGSSVLFGLSFLIITRKIPESNEISSKIKDYLTISAIGIVMIGLSISSSALQQTYGIAAHSLVLLASYLFSFGFYFSAISIAHDAGIRKAIRKTIGTDVLRIIGTAQYEQELQKRVRKVATEQQGLLAIEVGIQVPPVDPKPYVSWALAETNKVREDNGDAEKDSGAH